MTFSSIVLMLQIVQTINMPIRCTIKKCRMAIILMNYAFFCYAII